MKKKFFGWDVKEVEAYDAQGNKLTNVCTVEKKKLNLFHKNSEETEGDEKEKKNGVNVILLITAAASAVVAGALVVRNTRNKNDVSNGCIEEDGCYQTQSSLCENLNESIVADTNDTATSENVVEVNEF